MIQTFLTGIVSLVDNFMVAALGDSKMAGVNVANQINFVYLVVVNTICIAGGIYLSQHRGAGDKEGMRQAYRFKLILAFGISALYMVLCIFFAEPLIRVMLGGNAEGGEIVREGARYLRAVSASFIPIGISLAMSTSFRDTRALEEFGTSKPIVPLPGIGATILTDCAFMARDMLSLKEVILCIFTPGAGSSSYIVTTGPGRTETISPLTP